MVKPQRMRPSIASKYQPYAGVLGETVNSGLTLRRDVLTFMGASIVALLALVVDWVAAVAERYLRPKGI